jgi:hypothetical protein
MGCQQQKIARAPEPTTVDSAGSAGRLTAVVCLA